MQKDEGKVMRDESEVERVERYLEARWKFHEDHRADETWLLKRWLEAELVGESVSIAPLVS